MLSDHQLPSIFSRAYIIGGSPCCGKSTLAEMLCNQYGFHYYRADDHDWEHMQHSNPNRQPIMSKFSKMGWDEIWSQSPETLCADELSYYRERFSFILDDLSRFTLEKPVLLEGAAFLPHLIHECPVRPENVIFMVPTFEFQIQHYSQRPFVQTILKDCRKPKQAFENWMKRDHLFGLEVIRQANMHGYTVITVDGSIGIQEQFNIIKAQFKCLVSSWDAEI